MKILFVILFVILVGCNRDNDIDHEFPSALDGISPKISLLIDNKSIEMGDPSNAYDSDGKLLPRFVHFQMRRNLISSLNVLS